MCGVYVCVVHEYVCVVYVNMCMWCMWCYVCVLLLHLSFSFLLLCFYFSYWLHVESLKCTEFPLPETEGAGHGAKIALSKTQGRSEGTSPWIQTLVFL